MSSRSRSPYRATNVREGVRAPTKTAAATAAPISRAHRKRPRSRQQNEDEDEEAEADATAKRKEKHKEKRRANSKRVYNEKEEAMDDIGPLPNDRMEVLLNKYAGRAQNKQMIKTALEAFPSTISAGTTGTADMEFVGNNYNNYEAEHENSYFKEDREAQHVLRLGNLDSATTVGTVDTVATALTATTAADSINLRVGSAGSPGPGVEMGVAVVMSSPEEPPSPYQARQTYTSPNSQKRRQNGFGAAHRHRREPGMKDEQSPSDDYTETPTWVNGSG